MTVNTFIDLGNGWVFDWGFTLFMVTYFLVAMELNRYEHPSALSLRKTLNDIKNQNTEMFNYLKQHLE